MTRPHGYCEEGLRTKVRSVMTVGKGLCSIMISGPQEEQLSVSSLHMFAHGTDRRKSARAASAVQLLSDAGDTFSSHRSPDNDG